MKVLFLDFDGVLNSNRTVTAFGGWPHTLNELRMFDVVAIALIRRLSNAGVKLVVSSSWRDAYTLAQLQNMLHLEFFDKTPSLPQFSRGVEIATWLKKYEGNVTHYAIVDDVMQMLPEQTKYFVKTNSFDGLRYNDFVELCRILAVNPMEGEHVRDWRFDGRTLEWDNG